MMNEGINIKPTIRRATKSQTHELSLSSSNLSMLFERFVAFIDATPNTVRTYKTSLRQWFNI